MAEQVSLVETEFILREAQERSIPVRIVGSGKKVLACVQDVNREALVFSAPEIERQRFLAWESLSAYFDFRGKDMVFTSKVVRQNAASLTVVYPMRLLRSPARKHPRVSCPRGFSLEITLENEKVLLDYPQSGDYSDVSLPDMREGFDVSTLNTLVESFRKKSADMASESRVVLFKGKKPAGIEEELLGHYGKTLFIPCTRNPFPVEDPYPQSRIITYGMAGEYEGPEAASMGMRLDRVLVEKIGEGIFAEVWCPIQYYQYVVGYVYLANRDDRPQPMDSHVVDFAWEFARILAYYLKTQHYFKTESEDAPPRHSAAIVDLSASGCLLSIPTTTLAKRIKTGSTLEMLLTHPEGHFDLRGTVVRNYDDAQGSFYGVSFLNLQKDQISILYPKLYDLPYSGEDVVFGEARMLPLGGES